jgi:hypothetical protein
MSTTAEPLLRFSGPPRHLSALMSSEFCADLGTDRWAARFVSEDIAERIAEPMVIECVKHVQPGLRHVATRLPRTTPPGRYVVEVDVDGVPRQAVLDVHPSPRSTIFPRRTRLTVSPGQTVGVDLEVCNTGNVTLEVPSMTAFVLANSEALCRAIVNTVSTQREAVERPLDRLADEMLRYGYGGTVKARIRTKELIIEPGEVRALSAALRLPGPDEMETGRSYWGLWSVHPGKSHRVFLDVV